MMTPRKRSRSPVVQLMGSAEGKHSEETSEDAGPSSAKKARRSLQTGLSADDTQLSTEAQYSTVKSESPGPTSSLLPPSGITERVLQLLEDVAPLIGVNQLNHNEFTNFIGSLCSTRTQSLPYIQPPLPSSSSHLEAEKVEIPFLTWITAITNACTPLPKPMAPLLKMNKMSRYHSLAELWVPISRLRKLINKVNTAVLIIAGRAPPRNLEGWEVHKNKDGNYTAEGPLLNKCRGLNLVEALNLKDDLLELYGEADLHNLLGIPLMKCITSAQSTNQPDQILASKALSRFCVPITKYTIFSMTNLRILGDRLNEPIFTCSSTQVLSRGGTKQHGNNFVVPQGTLTT